MLRIYPSPPFRLDLTVWALRRLQINVIDRWDGTVYRRVFIRKNTPFEVAVKQSGTPHRPELLVRAEGISLGAELKAALIPTLAQMLGLGLRLAEFESLSQRDALLRELLTESPGLKPTKFPTVFEAFLNAYACQQLSLTVGLTLLNRLCAACAPRFGEHYAFPRPKDVAMQAPENLKNMGFSTRKAHNIVDLARQLEEGKMLLTEFNNLNDEMLINRLQEIPGVGRWTAEYVALRGMGRLDVFPADDLGGQVKIQQWLGLKERPSADQVRQVLKQWSPFRGLLYYYLMQHDHAGPAAKPQSPSLAPRS